MEVDVACWRQRQYLCVLFCIVVGITILLVASPANSLHPNSSDAPQPHTHVPSFRKPEDTAILITSAWIPTHPNTSMIERVINSTAHIRGLSRSAPIFVAIDHLPEKSIAAYPDKVTALDKYAMNLYKRYLLDPSVYIIPSMEHWHIGGNVFKGLSLIQQHFPQVEFVYSLQHDFEFVKDIDHVALTQTMRDHDSVNNSVNYIRFKYKKNEPRFPCGNHRTLQAGLSNITKTSRYSDNNHLVRFSWYMNDVIGSLGNFKRPPEGPMMYRAGQGHGCEQMGLYTYQEKEVISHLDGRHTQGQ